VNNIKKENLVKLSLDFMIFLAGFSSNLIIIWASPSAEIKEFTSVYVISNAVFSFLIYFQFTKSVNISAIWGAFLICTSLLLFSYFILNMKSSLYFFYPYFYLISDYIASQKLQSRAIRIYRLVSLSTLFPFVFEGIDFEGAIGFRLAYFLVSGFGILLYKKQIAPLSVSSRWIFVFLCYLSYTLPLYLVTILAKAPADLKIWYSVTQIGIAFILKYYDFISRGGIQKNEYLFKVCAYCSILIPLPVLYINFHFVFVINYWIGLAIIIYAGKYIKN
jgi:hypothetical protein